MQLLLVRHALPHRAEVTDGRADPGLTELGHRQADRLVAAVAAFGGADALYSSTMARARETAAPLGVPTAREDLREYDAELTFYVPVHLMRDSHPEVFTRMDAGHLPEDVDEDAFRARVVDVMDTIVAAHPGRRSVVVVCHAGSINVYLQELLDLDRPLTFPLDYAGITRVTVAGDGRRRVRSVNETGHVADLLG